MSPTLDPFRLLLISLAGWVKQHQREVIDYLEEENRVLREQLGNKRVRLNGDQRRRLAVKAKKLGGRGLQELKTLVTPETLLVEIAGLARQAKGVWMSQVARNLADAAEGFLVGKWYLIHDRIPCARQSSRRLWAASGVQSVKLLLS